VSSGTALAKPILRKKTEASEVHVSTNEASLEAPLNGTLWVLQLLGAILSFIVGFAKLSGDQQMTQTFAAIGIGQWIRYVTGLIEFASAILLLIPALAGIAALLVVPIMIGVILTQILISGGSPALPIGLLIIASIVAWGRKETTHRLIWRNDPKRATKATNAFSEVP
jgi:putative oxidoreductase